MGNKYAVITGGAGSLGLEVAKELSGNNLNIIIIDQDPQALVKVKDELSEKSTLYEGNAADLSLLERVAADVKKKDGAICHLVNTVSANPHKLFKDMTIDEIQDVVNTTLLSYIYAIRCFWDLFEPGGSIVNISSVHSTSTKKGNSVYAAGKAGVESITRALAAELREKNVRINAIAPGGFTSAFYKDYYPDWEEKVERGQVFTPTDMANIVVFLLSDKAKAINGETIIADGGVFTVRASSSDW